MNLIAIFRIPDNAAEDAFGQNFVQLDIGVDEISFTGPIFSVSPEDGYYDMPFSTIIIAEKTEDGSIDISWFTVFKSLEDGTEVPDVVHSLPADKLEEFILGAAKTVPPREHQH